MDNWSNLENLLPDFLGRELSRVLVGPAGVHFDFTFPDPDLSTAEILCCGELKIIDVDRIATIGIDTSNYIDAEACLSLDAGLSVVSLDMDSQLRAFMMVLSDSRWLIFTAADDPDEFPIFINLWAGSPHHSERIKSHTM